MIKEGKENRLGEGLGMPECGGAPEQRNKGTSAERVSRTRRDRSIAGKKRGTQLTDQNDRE